MSFFTRAFCATPAATPVAPRRCASKLIATLKSTLAAAAIFALAAAPRAHSLVLIQGAMEVETATLIAALEAPISHRLGSYEFVSGRLGGHEVLISRTLIGLSNAAAATATAIAHFRPRLVINQGTAGAIVPGLKFGEILVGARLVNAGAYKSRPSETSLDVRERDPLSAPLWLLNADGSAQKNEFFRSDAQLAKRAVRLFGAREVTIASADAFNQQKALLAHWAQLYGAQAEEMESVAAAQVAAAFGLPFLSLRIVSDNLADDVPYDPSVAKILQEKLIEKLGELLGE